MRSLPPLLVVAIVVSLAGCAVVGESSAGPSLAPSVPSVTPTATEPPAAQVAVLTTEGYGLVSIGSPVLSPGDLADVMQWYPTACSGYGAWAQTGFSPDDFENSQFIVDSAGSPDAPIDAIVFIGPGSLTDRGIGVSSTEAEFLAAYPDVDATFDLAQAGTQHNVNGTAGRLQFVVLGGEVVSIGLVAASLKPEDSRLGPTDWYLPCV